MALVAVAALVVTAGAVLLITQRWRMEQPGRLTATSRTCTVGYGSDLVVVAAEVTNRSSTAVTITGVGLAASTTDVARSDGPIDIVTATGCEHVLALRGDEVSPGATIWVGLTVRSFSCRASTLPLVVGSDSRSGTAAASISVPLPADTAPVCTTTDR